MFKPEHAPNTPRTPPASWVKSLPLLLPLLPQVPPIVPGDARVGLGDVEGQAAPLLAHLKISLAVLGVQNLFLWALMFLSGIIGIF